VGTRWLPGLGSRGGSQSRIDGKKRAGFHFDAAVAVPTLL